MIRYALALSVGVILAGCYPMPESPLSPVLQLPESCFPESDCLPPPCFPESECITPDPEPPACTPESECLPPAPCVLESDCILESNR